MVGCSHAFTVPQYCEVPTPYCEGVMQRPDGDDAASNDGATAVTVTLTSVIFALGVGAHPTYVQCDRTTRTSSGATGSDVAQRSSIMGMTVQTSTTAIVSAPAVASYNASTTVTLTLSGLGPGRSCTRRLGR